MNKETIRKHLRIPAKLHQEIEQYKRDYHFPSTSQAIVYLIHMGLRYTKKIEEQSISDLERGSEGNTDDSFIEEEQETTL